MESRRIPAIALVTLFVAAPLATCLAAVEAHATTAMEPGDDCGAPRTGEAPVLCGPQMIAASAPAVAVFPIVLGPAAGALAPTADLTARAAPPIRDAGPPGARPPAWLRHSAFLI